MLIDGAKTFVFEQKSCSMNCLCGNQDSSWQLEAVLSNVWFRNLLFRIYLDDISHNHIIESQTQFHFEHFKRWLLRACCE